MQHKTADSSNVIFFTSQNHCNFVPLIGNVLSQPQVRGPGMEIIQKIIKLSLGSCKAQYVVFTASISGFVMLGIDAACQADGPYKFPLITGRAVDAQTFHCRSGIFCERLRLEIQSFLNFPLILDWRIHCSLNVCVSMAGSKHEVFP